ncbi:hypothetical protein Tco_0453936 [Tanacetum coccineum]
MQKSPEVERERQREEEASKAAIAETYDEVQAGIDADALFVAKLQQEEREEYTIEERAKFLAEIIVAQRKFRANIGGYKHSQLKAKTFAEIQGRATKGFSKDSSVKKEIIDYEVLEKRFPIINWESKFYDFDRHGAECIYYRIFRSDGSSRFENTSPEGVDLVLWGDLRIMFDANYGIEIHMLAERKYPLTKETLERMLSFGV